MLVAGVLAALLAAAAWMAWNGLQARDRLLEALPAVQRLQAEVSAGEADAAAATLADLQAATSDARDRTDGPLWAAARVLPLVGDDVTAATSAIQVVDDVAQRALPPAVEASGAFDPAALQPKDGRIALEPIQQAAPLLRTAAEESTHAARAASEIDLEGVDARIAGPVTDLGDQLAEAADTATTAADAAHVLPPMLGAEGPRSYLVLFQNNAEVRATGGIPGSMALVTADDGRLALAAQASSSDFPRYDEPVLDLPPELLALHGDSFGRFMQDVNLTPHYPVAAQLAREMWAREFDQQVDGVLATDPVALSYLLEATGPVPLATGGELTAENAVPLLLSEVYATYEDPRAQDAFFAASAAAVFEALTNGQGDPHALVDQLVRAAGERRLLVWSADDVEQQVVAGTVLEGAVATGDAARDVVGVYLNDGTRSKMSYYLRTEVTLRPCAGDPTAWQVEVALTSTAPEGAGKLLPDYVLGGLQAGGVPPGVIRTEVLLYASDGSAVTAVTRGGESARLSSQVAFGRQVAGVLVDVAPGDSVSYELQVARPDAVSIPYMHTTPGVVATVTREPTATCVGS
ncbi:MAG: DUF4012 domain-containing protein [Actinomycetes bacterium]